ncbi:MAG: ribonuclease HI [Alphaproteobacteria bacterium RIFCSPLOWO2_01_FULL_45_8]|nr:MAG: ribonuclease HI [Alphaproteobacteria bacterium GWB1_45_5]OFW76212.1 MAG: ribonuclease HI [Alphaproteobacteria bacterium GWA1_45_9]OFW89519.1 MAG: ribonuclease HI [Alphaproteobacteria bacterium RIFCSPHIGHO2_01_FULL_41_14]OFW95651.1 MAG: ribonuclease HI [Alphaproteobacteria bacterium RIFCSPLOWO2_01_FULL_45_8]HCI48726.1 ribonuclease HI [Holosporales bacterium]
MNKDFIEIFTDGACQGNPGPGGWAALLRYKGHLKEIFGREDHTTNNRMELLAAIRGIEAVRKKVSIMLYTDSQYLKKGMTEWLPQWKQNQWRNAQKKEIKNKDLWQELDVLGQEYSISWHWVKGHAGHPENDRADYLATQAIHRLSASKD